MSIDAEQLAFLCDAPKELLVEIICRMEAQIDELKAFFVLPKEPHSGQFVVRDGSGEVRLIADEDKWAIAQVEGVAILLSFGSYCEVHFYLNNRSRVLSQWSHGKKVL